MPNLRCIAAQVLVLLLATSPALAGQTSPGPSGAMVYLTGGVGGGTLGVAGHAALTVHVPEGEFTLRLAGVSQFNFWQPDDDASDVALLYGVRHVTGTTWGSLGAGPAIVRATFVGRCLGSVGWLGCSAYQIDHRRAVGLAFHAAAGWAPAMGFGVGVSVLGDVNAARSFVAVTVDVQLGKLR